MIPNQKTHRATAQALSQGWEGASYASQALKSSGLHGLQERQGMLPWALIVGIILVVQGILRKVGIFLPRSGELGPSSTCVAPKSRARTKPMPYFLISGLEHPLGSERRAALQDGNSLKTGKLLACPKHIQTCPNHATLASKTVQIRAGTCLNSKNQLERSSSS